MKKFLIGGSVAVFVFALSVSFAFAAKPSATCKTIQGGTLEDTKGNEIALGYDQWGYNYQARMFNGWYDNYSRPDVIATGGDRLMMKWNDAWLSNKDCNGDSKLDRHLGLGSYIGSGAWLTNHATGTYNGSNFDWNATGNYIMVHHYLGQDYAHDMNLIDTNGVLSGNGGYPAGGAYQYAWTITSGSITGDAIDFYADYTLGAIGTTMHVTGTINSDGSMSGDWSDNYGGTRNGTWSTSGTTVATKVFETCEWSDFVKIVAAPADATKVGGFWLSADGTEIGPDIWGEFAIIQEVTSDPCGDFNLADYKSQLRAGLGNW